MRAPLRFWPTTRALLLEDLAEPRLHRYDHASFRGGQRHHHMAHVVGERKPYTSANRHIASHQWIQQRHEQFERAMRQASSDPPQRASHEKVRPVSLTSVDPDGQTPAGAQRAVGGTYNRIGIGNVM